MAFQTPLIPDPQKGSSTNPPAAVIGLTGADLDRRSRSLDGSVSDNPRSMYNSACGPSRPGPTPGAPCRSQPPRPWSPPTCPI